MSAALSTKPLASEWFDALADDDEQADRLALETNAARLEADLLARFG